MCERDRCPECGAELPSGMLAGLCPRCLLAAGLESRSDEPSPEGRSSEAPTTPHSGSIVPPEPEALAELLPQLEILELVGHGGMGAVYKARQKHLDRLVALKVIRPESTHYPAFAERFNREARMLARLNHPQIVAVYDFGAVRIPDAAAGNEPRSLYYILMEYVDGASLRELMRAGELTPQQALAIVPQICEALQFAHDEGVVHRDIKPENILLDKRGRVKIADFGLAKLAARSPDDFTLTGTHQVMGTPRYMAPEQMEGSHAVDHRADIYSLGIVFYEMLTGEVPAGHFEPPSKKVEIDVRLDDVVLRSLAQEPERRYQQVSEVKTAVESISSAAISSNSSRADSSPAISTLPPGIGPRLLLLSGAMVVGAIIVAVGLVLLAFAFRESTGSDAFWGLAGSAFGCIIGGAGALAGTWYSYRQVEGTPDLLDEPQRTWLDRGIGGYTLVGFLAMVAAMVLSLWLPWYPVCYGLMLLGGIAVFQGVLFLIIRGLTRRAAWQEKMARGEEVQQFVRLGQLSSAERFDVPPISANEEHIETPEDESGSPTQVTARLPRNWFWAGLAVLLPVLALIAFLMYWSSSPWLLVALVLPWFVMGGALGLIIGGDEDAQTIKSAVFAWLALTVAASAALLGYGIFLTSSAEPVWAVAAWTIAAFAGFGLAAGAVAIYESMTAEEDQQKQEQRKAEAAIQDPAQFMVLASFVATCWLLSKGGDELLGFLRGEYQALSPELLFVLGAPLVLFGGITMQWFSSYWLAVTASVLCLPLGFGSEQVLVRLVPFGLGLWSLSALMRPEVREAFRRKKNPSLLSVNVLDSSEHDDRKANHPRSTLGRAWDDWWAERDRWLTDGVQWLLGLVFMVGVIMYIGWHWRSERLPDADGQRLRHTTVTYGVPDPWFEYETYPDKRTPSRLKIDPICSSTGIMLLGFLAWWVNWQIEKAKAKLSGKQLRWWHGSPIFAVGIWGVVTLTLVVAAFAFAE